jgi:hypothetical protein
MKKSKFEQVKLQTHITVMSKRSQSQSCRSNLLSHCAQWNKHVMYEAGLSVLLVFTLTFPQDFTAQLLSRIEHLNCGINLCTVLLPPGVNPITVNKYIISCHIIYRIISYRIVSYIITYRVLSYIISYIVSYQFNNMQPNLHVKSPQKEQTVDFIRRQLIP